jgi:hypothetical protein
MVWDLQATTGADSHAGDLLMSSLFNRLQDEIDAQERQDGISPVDLLDMPAPLAKIVKLIVRRNGMKLENIAEAVNQSAEDVQNTLAELVQKGYVREVKVKQDVWYKARFAQKRSRTLSSSFWALLADTEKPEEE